MVTNISYTIRTKPEGTGGKASGFSYLMGNVEDDIMDRHRP